MLLLKQMVDMDMGGDHNKRVGENFQLVLLKQIS